MSNAGPVFRRTALAALALAAGLAGCGGDNPREVVRQTAKNLARVHSANLYLRIGLHPLDSPRGGLALSLNGPFSLPAAGELPTARITYVQSAGSRRTVATLISTPREAFVSLRGASYRLPERLAERLRTTGPRRGSVSLAQLHVADWIENPSAHDAPGGAERVTGRLDVVAAVRDVLAAQRRAGGNALELSSREARRLRESVRSSSVELVTGRQDRQLRRLRGSATVAVPTRLRRQLGRLSLRMAFEMRLRDVNRPVQVRAPARALPLPAR
jgi:hypothetical protein